MTVSTRSQTFTRTLVGQKALVTGANSSIGRAVAIGLGEAGADVVVNYVVDEQAAEEVVNQIRAIAVWLASDRSDYVVGATLFVDGGISLYPGFATGG